MAYTAPVHDASGQTWTQLKSRGFIGHVRTSMGALTTNPPTVAATSYLGHMMEPNKSSLPIIRARNLVDMYISGKSDKVSTKTALFDLQQVFLELAACIGEIGVLVDAN